MIKSIKYFLVIFVSIFGFSLSVLAESSNFEPFITMDTDITENQVKLALGFAGEELMTVKSYLMLVLQLKITYLNHKLKYF